ncbi:MULTISPECIES: RluA family pseudouridine synthase [Persephonella]|uniref:Pseudouridine synthase n=1 Tax=Persephonella marina (strain DSM 14350 / EX-H1) TaxID=123214 RepID=C0QPR5_PERMH|nr:MULTISPECIES: RluA family pseudouridine synthase [Persephonella]ACO04000.1 ribosomal large subunit pseudouridine synthase, RluA family [Persephonella marina EX-H1]
MNHKDEILSFMVDEEYDRKRLDQFLSSVYPEYSRSYFQKLIKDGYVFEDGKDIKKPSYKVRKGQEITLVIPPPETLEIKPENIPVDILFEDEDIAVVYKPAGMVVHPSPGHTSGTLVNALLYHFRNISEYGGKERAGIVHRLDKDTAGLMIIAKSEFAHKELQKQFQERTVDKRYIAVVTGIVQNDHGFIDLPIGRSIYNRKKMGTEATNLRDALTEYWVKNRSEKENLTVVDIKLHTGRTHQIRVHFSAIGHPLFNDKVYGFKKSQLRSEKMRSISDQTLYHALLAYRIAFDHPRTGEKIDITLQKLPEHISKVIEAI